jgi:hypothetical protein
VIAAVEPASTIESFADAVEVGVGVGVAVTVAVVVEAGSGPVDVPHRPTDIRSSQYSVAMSSRPNGEIGHQTFTPNAAPDCYC